MHSVALDADDYMEKHIGNKRVTTTYLREGICYQLISQVYLFKELRISHELSIALLLRLSRFFLNITTNYLALPVTLRYNGDDVMVWVRIRNEAYTELHFIRNNVLIVHNIIYFHMQEWWESNLFTWTHTHIVQH